MRRRSLSISALLLGMVVFSLTIVVQVGGSTALAAIASANSLAPPIEDLSFNPPSPASVGTTVHIHCKATWDPTFRAMRLKIDGNIAYELGAPEFTRDWQTGGYSPGSHVILLEVAALGDNDWTNPTRRQETYILQAAPAPTTPAPPPATPTATPTTHVPPPAAPAAPSGLWAQAGSQTEMNLGWVDNSGNEDGFKIYRDGQLIKTLGGNRTRWLDTGLHCGTTYQYYVTAYNGNGESAASNIATADTHDCSPAPSPTTTAPPQPTTPTPPSPTTPVPARTPAAPTGLQATAASESAINLRWTDNADNEQGFHIYRDGQRVGSIGRADIESYGDGVGLSPGTTYSYYVTAYNQHGESSRSNTVSARTHDAPAGPICTGFLPNPNGYSFPNWQRISYAECTDEDMGILFGDANVFCVDGSGNKILTKAAKQWRTTYYEQKMQGWHCVGMAATSLINFWNGIPSFPMTLDTDLRRKTTRYSLMWYTKPARDGATCDPAQETVNNLVSALSGSRSNAVFLSLWSGHGMAHSVVPYCIEKIGNQRWRVKVYDSFSPGVDSCAVEVDTATDRFTYNCGSYGGKVSGCGLIISGLSGYHEPQDWVASRSSSTVQVSAAGGGRLLITDSNGRRIGYVGDDLVNEIPGATYLPVASGTQAGAEPVYVLPVEGVYSIIADGHTLDQGETMKVTQFGPQHALGVENIALESGEQDRVSFATDGTEISYRASSRKEADLVLIREDVNQSDGFYLRRVDLRSNRWTHLRNEPDDGRLILDNADGRRGHYDLEITLIDATDGERTFRHADISVSGGDTQYARYGDWDGSGAMTLQVDHDSDGTIDETLELENETRSIWAVDLPLINPLSATALTEELRYDDGGVETGLMNGPGQMGAVRFTVNSPRQVQALKFYVKGQSNIVRLWLYNADWQPLYTEDVQMDLPDPDTLVWFEWYVADHGLLVEGDFYVALEWLSDGPMLLVDDGPPISERSYAGEFPPDYLCPAGNIMIRAVLSDVLIG